MKILLLVPFILLVGCGSPSKPQPTPTPAPTYSQKVYVQLRTDARIICIDDAAMTVEVNPSPQYNKDLNQWHKDVRQYAIDQSKLEQRGYRTPNYVQMKNIVCP